MLILLSLIKKALTKGAHFESLLNNLGIGKADISLVLTLVIIYKLLTKSPALAVLCIKLLKLAF